MAHGVTTDFGETDSFAHFRKQYATGGGLSIQAATAGGGGGATESAIAMIGYVTANETTKTTAGTAGVYITVGKISGAGGGANDSNSNLLAVRDWTNTRFILDSDGDSHQDVGTAWTNFDDFNDLAVIDSLAFNVSRKDNQIRERFLESLEYHRDKLESLGLVTFNENGHHFVNMSKLTMLLTGALRQMGHRLDSIERKLLQ